MCRIAELKKQEMAEKVELSKTFSRYNKSSHKRTPLMDSCAAMLMRINYSLCVYIRISSHGATPMTTILASKTTVVRPVIITSKVLNAKMFQKPCELTI